jgi:hypothetical protein
MAPWLTTAIVERLRGIIAYADSSSNRTQFKSGIMFDPLKPTRLDRGRTKAAIRPGAWNAMPPALVSRQPVMGLENVNVESDGVKSNEGIPLIAGMGIFQLVTTPVDVFKTNVPEKFVVEFRVPATVKVTESAFAAPVKRSSVASASPAENPVVLLLIGPPSSMSPDVGVPELSH